MELQEILKCLQKKGQFPGRLNQSCEEAHFSQQQTRRQGDSPFCSRLFLCLYPFKQASTTQSIQSTFCRSSLKPLPSLVDTSRGPLAPPGLHSAVPLPTCEGTTCHFLNQQNMGKATAWYFCGHDTSRMNQSCQQTHSGDGPCKLEGESNHVEEAHVVRSCGQPLDYRQQKTAALCPAVGRD